MAKVTPVDDFAPESVIWHALEANRLFDNALDTKQRPWYIVHPRAKLKLAWDFLCLLLLVYCVIDVPFTFAFVGQDILPRNVTLTEIPNDSEAIFTGYGLWSLILDILFLIDTVLNFFTAIAVKKSHGALDDEEAEEVLDSNFKNIFRSYLSSWFFPDLISSLPLDTILINIDIADTKSLLRIPRVLKVFRAVRLVKLLRLRRSSSYLASISHMIEVNPGIIRIVKFFMIFLLLAHYLSCAMFFIGTLDSYDLSGNPTTWLTQTVIVGTSGEEMPLSLAPMAEQYLWTLYWTITTMTTVGFGDIRPITEAEVIMSIFTMIIGGGVFSFIVGNTANLLTRLDSQGKELEDLMERVSDFMQHNKVPLALRDQCARWIKFQNVNSVLIPKALTHNLSDTLRAELYVFVNRGFLERTAVLSRHLSRRQSLPNGVHGEDEGAHAAATDGRNQDDRFLGLLMEACREQHLCPGETIFIQGCTGTDMYFIEQGQVDITRLREDGSSSCVLSTLYTGAVFGEGSFVSKDNERRTYTARSRTWLKLKVISTPELKAIASRFPRLKAPFLHDIEQFSKKFEESLQISMKLEDKIGRLTARKGDVVPDSIVQSILANAYMVHKWRDPESVFSDSVVQAAESSAPVNTEVQSLVDSVSDMFNDLSPRPKAQAAAVKDMHSLASLLDGFGDTISMLEDSEKGRIEAFQEIRALTQKVCAQSKNANFQKKSGHADKFKQGAAVQQNLQ